MGKHLLNLPWPSSALSSNARGHWAKKDRATNAARTAAYFIAKKQHVTTDAEAILTFTYYPPDGRKRDCQNIPHMLKAYIDGIADAMGCDDNGFLVRYPDQFADPVKGGAILCEVECGSDGTAEIPVKGNIS